jgi:transposase-like protein
MGPQRQFCPNFYCPHRGKTGQGNIRTHSRKEGRLRCATCGKTFAATKNAPFYRLHKPHDLAATVLTLLAHGCPLQAAVEAFGIDERTVASWQEKAGLHCQRFHELHVQQGRVDAQHAQADELWAKVVGRRVWVAMALAVPSRLWLGGVSSRRRDRRLLAALVAAVKACLPTLAVLVCVDGLASYATAFARASRHREPRRGRPGRCRLVVEPGLLIGQVVKRRARWRVVGVVRRVVRGTGEAVAGVLARTGAGGGVNAAYIERLNATFRGCLSGLVRRGRALLREEGRLRAGTYLVGCAYNWCRAHASPGGAAGGRTPAMAAGLTDRRWGLGEVLAARPPPARWKAPRKRPRRRRRARDGPRLAEVA